LYEKLFGSLLFLLLYLESDYRRPLGIVRTFAFFGLFTVQFSKTFALLRWRYLQRALLLYHRPPGKSILFSIFLKFFSQGKNGKGPPGGSPLIIANSPRESKVFLIFS
ncbi:MAG: hypothetical protein K6B40_05805, partial [Firmicutes bacterium]|nr:hypothetical protein [Bacillota bacterium]